MRLIMRFFRSKTPEENLIIHKNIPLNSRTNTDNVSICKCLMNSRSFTTTVLIPQPSNWVNEFGRRVNLINTRNCILSLHLYRILIE